MRLEPELIPEPLWRLSAASLLGRKSKEWRAIRADALVEANNTCYACGEETPGGRYMVCDEVWAYDETKGTATLTGVRIVCPSCDQARHFERAAQYGRGDEALATLARVNGVETDAAKAMQEEARNEFQRRSRLAWTVSVEPSFLARYPAVAVLTGQSGAPADGTMRLVAEGMRRRLGPDVTVEVQRH